jgi:hypothetical protein
MVGGGSRIVNGLANGMIAAGAAGIVDEVLAKFGGDAPKDDEEVVAGVGNVFMNGVGGDQTLMGNVDFNTYASDSSDDTSAGAGEMNY